MRELVFIGDDIPAQAPAFIKPFHDRSTEEQFTWEQAMDFVRYDRASIRPATDLEIESALVHLNLIQACTAYLSQFTEQSEA